MAAAPLIIAHRGASHDAPENTLAAFRLAWEQAADGIESDWRLTNDKRLVCLHDEDLRRVADSQRRVSELTFDAIRRIDVGSWKDPRYRDERTPSLAEVLATVPVGKKVFLELKEGPEIIEPLMGELGAIEFALGQIVVIAFDADTIAECKRQLPELRCHWLTSFENHNREWSPTALEVALAVKRCGADGVGFQGERRVLDLSFVLAAGVAEFHVWTVDDPEDAAYFKRQGAYGVTTNRPGWLREQLNVTRPSGS